MNFRDFYKKELSAADGESGELSAASVDPKQLSMGVEVEMEHTHDPKIARKIALDHLKEDPQYYSRLQQAGLADELPPTKKYGGLEPLQPITGLDVPSRIRPVSIAKIISPAVCFGKGAVNVSNGQAVGSVPDDKEKITAAGQSDETMAAKSVGGHVIPGKGQVQGGPNTKGCIAGTKADSLGECGADTKGPNTKGSINGTPKNPAIGLKGAELIQGSEFEEASEPEDSEQGEEISIELDDDLKNAVKEVVSEIVSEEKRKRSQKTPVSKSKISESRLKKKVTPSLLSKEAAYISRKINEGRELTADEVDIIREIIMVKARHLKENIDDKGWEYAAEHQDAVLDSYIEDTVKYRGREDTTEDLLSAITVGAEDLGVKHIDDERVRQQIEKLMQKYPAKY